MIQNPYNQPKKLENKYNDLTDPFDFTPEKDDQNTKANRITLTQEDPTQESKRNTSRQNIHK